MFFVSGEQFLIFMLSGILECRVSCDHFFFGAPRFWCTVFDLLRSRHLKTDHRIKLRIEISVFIKTLTLRKLFCINHWILLLLLFRSQTCCKKLYEILGTNIFVVSVELTFVVMEKLLPTKHIDLTFNTSVLPTKIEMHWIVTFAFASCLKCQRFSHTQLPCQRTVTFTRLV